MQLRHGFGEAPRNFRAKRPICSERRDNKAVGVVGWSLYTIAAILTPLFVSDLSFTDDSALMRHSRTWTLQATKRLTLDIKTPCFPIAIWLFRPRLEHHNGFNNANFQFKRNVYKYADDDSFSNHHASTKTTRLRLDWATGNSMDRPFGLRLTFSMLHHLYRP
jgi:hypothetical protein